MRDAFTDYKEGHTPVTTGRAPWLPGQFPEAMRFVRGCVTDEEIRHAAAVAKSNKGARRG